MILIKNVAQTISAYSMSCFLLPRTLSQEIKRIFNGNWWKSGTSQTKGVNWLSWEGMSMAKSRGGLGFKNLYGFNLALIGKQVWRCMDQPDMLVTRMLKANYFPNLHILKAVKGQGPSFIWQSIWQTKEVMAEDFRCVVGDGRNIMATKDPWLSRKADFKVCNHWRYEGRNETVETLFHPGTKVWDTGKVRELFNTDDANTILETFVPQRAVEDRIVWAMSNDGNYTVKTGYHFWHNRNVGDSICTQSGGWKKIWRLNVPHKLKVFLWRFCRNNLPVRNRLRHKGIHITIMCPFCNADVEHSIHLFFDCDFAKQCWHAAGLCFDMSQVYSAPDWLIHKLDTANQEESIMVASVLWGIFFWRNKKVWEDKAVTTDVAMVLSLNNVLDWRKARVQKGLGCPGNRNIVCSNDRKWKPPPHSAVKVNVDASFSSQMESFSVGMVA